MSFIDSLPGAVAKAARPRRRVRRSGPIGDTKSAADLNRGRNYRPPRAARPSWTRPVGAVGFRGAQRKARRRVARAQHRVPHRKSSNLGRQYMASRLLSDIIRAQHTRLPSGREHQIAAHFVAGRRVSTGDIGALGKLHTALMAPSALERARSRFYNDPAYRKALAKANKGLTFTPHSYGQWTPATLTPGHIAAGVAHGLARVGGVAGTFIMGGEGPNAVLKVAKNAEKGTGFAGRVASDLLTVGAETVPSFYHLGSEAAHGHVGRAAGELVKPYVDLAKHPGKSFEKHPLISALLLEGARAGAGRTAGAVVRHAPVEAVRRAGSTKRAPAVVEGTRLAHVRRFSPDLGRKGVQAASDALGEKRARRLTAKAARMESAGKPAGDVLAKREKANRVNPRVMSPQRVRKRMDLREELNSQVAQLESHKVTAEHRKLAVRRAGGAPSAVAQGLAAPTRAGLEHLIAHWDREHANGLTRVGKRANRQAVRELKVALRGLDSGKLSPAQVVDVARGHRAIMERVQQQAADLGVLPKFRAERSTLVPHAVLEMGAEVHPTHGLVRSAAGFGDAVKALSAASRKQRRVKAIFAGKASKKAKEARQTAQDAVDAAQAGVDRFKLSNAEVRQHMAKQGKEPPSFVSHRPDVTGFGSFYRHWMGQFGNAPPGVGVAARTGEAVKQGRVDLGHEAMTASASRLTHITQAAHGYDRFIHEAALLKDGGKDRRRFATRKQAGTVVDELKAAGKGAWRAVRERPFHGQEHNVEAALEDAAAKGHAGTAEAQAHEAIIRGLTDAEHIAGDAHGPWVLVPEDAARRVEQHQRVLGPLPGTRALKVSAGQLRRTVLATSPKWGMGNVAEGGLRVGVKRANPVADFYLGRKLIAKQGEFDKVSAQELEVIARQGGHYGYAQRMHQKTFAEHFAGSNLEKAAKVATMIGHAPVARWLPKAWEVWTRYVFGSMRAFESSLTTAIVGKHAREFHMEGRIFKYGPKAIEQAAHGLRNTPEQAELAQAIYDAYGKYGGFGPEGRANIRTMTPFIPWFINAVSWIAVVLPRDHPVVTSLMAAANQATEQWRKKHGDIPPGMGPGAKPGWLQGSADQRRLSRYTPFGAWGDPGGTFADSVLPQWRDVLNALNGRDWKGDRVNKYGSEPSFLENAVMAVGAMVGGFVPTAGPIQRLAAGKGPLTKRLNREFNPLAPVKTPAKSRGTGGGSDSLFHSGGGSSDSLFH